ncbi:HNH endonuclease signature motif containing protein [Actinomadura bangladeshensis]|nr:HNH endonuclease signature motif containing protein [Actinomadura bangladeshensis]
MPSVVLGSQREWEDREWFPPGPQLAICLSGGKERLADLTDDELLQVAAAARRQTSWAQARELAAIAELTQRRARAEADGDPDYRILSARDSVTEEVAAALTITSNASATLLHLAERLTGPLADTGAALEAGRVDLAKARVISDLTEGLPEQVTQRVQVAALEKASTQTTGQLRRQIRRIVQRLAPEAIAERKREAVRQRRLELWDTPSGTSDLALCDLAAEDAHAIYNKITAAAHGIKSEGDIRPLNTIRADLAKQLLQGSPLPEAIRDLLTQTCADTPQPVPANDFRPSPSVEADSCPDLRQTGAPTPSAPHRPGHPGHPLQMGAGAGDGGRAAGAPRATANDAQSGSNDVVGVVAGVSGRGAALPDHLAPVPAQVSASNALAMEPGDMASGHATAPHLLALGSSDARRLHVSVPGRVGPVPGHLLPVPAGVRGDPFQGQASALGRLSPGSDDAAPGLPGTPDHPALAEDASDGVSVASSSGIAPAEADGAGVRGARACADAEVFMLADVIGQRLAHVSGRVPSRELPGAVRRAVQRIRHELADAREAACRGGDEVHGRPGYRPSAAMRREVEARHATCVFPSCNQPSHRCDLDHTVPWRPGITCLCNLAPLCRRHHRLKQRPDWRLVQVWPGLLIWVTPSGAWYIVRPDRR